MADPEPKRLPVHLGMTIQQAERVLIVATLEHTGWQIVKAAAMLGIDRSTLYAKMIRYAIGRPRTEAPEHER